MILVEESNIQYKKILLTQGNARGTTEYRQNKLKENNI